jgi:hypothetical protein
MNTMAEQQGGETPRLVTTKHYRDATLMQMPHSALLQLLATTRVRGISLNSVSSNSSRARTRACPQSAVGRDSRQRRQRPSASRVW